MPTFIPAPRGEMARHNRKGEGQDQLGRSYVVSYQPDWFRRIKVTRKLQSGRRSTKTLFTNPEPPEALAGPKVRTRVQSAALGLDVEVVLDDPAAAVTSISVEAVVQNGLDRGQRIGFTISPHAGRKQALGD